MNILVALFGAKHLTGLLFVVVWILFLFLLLGKLNIKEKQFALVFAIAFWVLEIIKISFMWIGSTYPLNHLPFHLCSMPLYLFPLYYFAKSGSLLERYAKAGIYGIVFTAGLIALIMPTNIIGSHESWALVRDNFLPILSFIYHGTMIFVPLYMLIKHFYTFEYRDVLKAFVCGAALMVLAMIVNAVLDKDFMMLRYGKGSPVQFLLDTSQILYTFSMIIFGFFIIHLNFGVTALIMTLKKKQ